MESHYVVTQWYIHCIKTVLKNLSVSQTVSVNAFAYAHMQPDTKGDIDLHTSEQTKKKVGLSEHLSHISAPANALLFHRQ